MFFSLLTDVDFWIGEAIIIGKVDVSVQANTWRFALHLHKQFPGILRIPGILTYVASTKNKNQGFSQPE